MVGGVVGDELRRPPAKPILVSKTPEESYFLFGGGWGRRVTTEEELDAALAQARGSKEGRALIDIVLDRLDTSSEALKRLGAELSPDKGRGRRVERQVRGEGDAGPIRAPDFCRTPIKSCASFAGRVRGDGRGAGSGGTG